MSELQAKQGLSSRVFEQGLSLFCGGLIFWLVFSVLAVFVRGVRWDENFEFARILTGQTPFPADHPLNQYLHSMFSLQTYLMTALVALGAGEALACGLRNILFLLATVLPVFIFTTRLTGKMRWGHVAALLTLEGVMLEFDGSYPLAVWPLIYSNGHIGGGFALVTLYVLLAGHRRVAALMAMLMPAIHIGQAPVLLALCGMCVCVAAYQGKWRELQRVVPWAVVGLTVCAILAVVMYCMAVPAPIDGPYAVAGDSDPIWRGFIAYSDPHRRFPSGNGHVAMLGMLLLSGLAAWRESDKTVQRIYKGLFIYTLIVAATVWGIMAVHAYMGANIPKLLIQWMPYRLINHIPPLLLAVILSVLCRARNTALIVPGALLIAALRPLMGPLLGEELYMRYIFVGDAITFGLYGAALVAITPEHTKRLQVWRPLLVVLALAAYHQFGAACMAMGVITTIWISGINKTRVAKVLNGRMVVGGICVLSAVLMLLNQFNHRQHLPRSDFDRQVAEILATQSEPAAPIIAPPESYALQARLNHAILVEAATGSYLTYMPKSAPTIQRLYNDLYGIRFDRPSQPVPWEQCWTRRTRTQWQSLAQRYNATYVIAPSELPLDLPTVLRHKQEVLYLIPAP